MTNEEMELLNSLRGPNATLKADAARYMKEFSFRASVDKADRESGTTLGRTLKSIWLGKPATQDAPAPEVKAPSAIELANACKKFPRDRCMDLYKRKGGQPGEVLSSLSKAERDEAKLAAQFFKILDPSDTASVRFNYETSGQRRAKREATDAEAQRQADQLPPGISRDADGGLLLTDSAAFETWKAGKTEHKAAIDYLESQAV
jgi:hypothetical protein